MERFRASKHTKTIREHQDWNFAFFIAFLGIHTFTIPMTHTCDPSSKVRRSLQGFHSNYPRYCSDKKTRAKNGVSGSQNPTLTSTQKNEKEPKTQAPRQNSRAWDLGCAYIPLQQKKLHPSFPFPSAARKKLRCVKGVRQKQKGQKDGKEKENKTELRFMFSVGALNVSQKVSVKKLILYLFLIKNSLHWNHGANPFC